MKPSSPFRLGLAGAAVLAFAAAVAYSNSFAGPFVFDDSLSIPRNATIRHLWPISIPLHPIGFGATVDSRPLLNLSLAVNYAVSGTEVWSYHLFNLAIHAAAALTLFGIVRRIIGRCFPAVGASAAAAFALAVALLWELHPLQTESVTYLIQRAESLMGLCFLFTLYGFIRAEGARGGAARAWQGGSWAACLCGMGCKEVMVMAPVMVLACDALLFAGSWRGTWRRHWVYYTALAATWLPLAVLVRHAGDRGGKSGPGSVGFVQYWLTQPPAIAHYLRLVFWPHPLVLDYGVTWVKSAWSVLPPGLLLLLLLAATATALGRRRRPGWAVAGFMGLWFFALLAPTSLVPGNRQTLAEHRMYLASIPVVAAGTWILAAAARRWLHWRLAARLGAVGVLALAAGWATYERNTAYVSERSLFGRDIAARPDDAYAQFNFGTDCLNDRQPAEAIGHLRTAMRLGLDNGQVEHNYGMALVALGRPKEAEAYFAKAVRLTVGVQRVEDYYFQDLIELGRMDEAIAERVQSLRRFPGVVESQVLLAWAMIQGGDVRSGLALCAALVQAYPEDPQLRTDFGVALAKTGRQSEAIERYRQALRLRPDFAAAHFNLAEALAATSRPTEAIAEFRAALKDGPDLPYAHYNLGLALLGQGEADSAAAEFRAVLRRMPDNYWTHDHLGDALSQLGRTAEARAEYREALRLKPDFSAARQKLEALGSGG